MSRPKTKTEDDWNGHVRLPSSLQKKIKREADRERRSFTAQLVVLLETHPALS